MFPTQAELFNITVKDYIAKWNNGNPTPIVAIYRNGQVLHESANLGTLNLQQVSILLGTGHMLPFINKSSL
ncbi:hypothetical protein H4R21_003040 [Coemansia helicoidea]|uniref:Uncharacterized protein n=1 Tax=Coemansia helicoidea TaxID=1286919 RepID=A0ACC1L4H7_9FUNG|nr:hypothetical protein H4R21_003040 [Coemansia helicoidea]